jgi:hypothetical protein
MNPSLTSPVIDEVLRPADLSDARVRERLSHVALHAFFTIMQPWKVSDGDARAILGGIDKETYETLKRQSPTRTLDANTLIRISHSSESVRHSIQYSRSRLPMNGSHCRTPIRSSVARDLLHAWSYADRL